MKKARIIILSQELESEIEIMNTDDYKWGVNWSSMLQNLLEDNQDRTTEEDKKILKQWERELDDVR